MSDTLATLQQALGRKPGLQRIPLPTESYQHASKPLSSKLLINLHAEAAPTGRR